jgi:V/A-type H+-transporting ATPase subunit D
LAVKFQYNKVSMQAIQKELKIRMAALPTLKSKEAYLRITIKKEKHRLIDLNNTLEALRSGIGDSERLFSEFPLPSLRISTVEYSSDNIAGISIPVLGEIGFHEYSESSVQDPSWLSWGWSTVKNLIRSLSEIDVAEKRVELLDYARKKTTQKVNLYEKVQIPEFTEAALKIKRYLEDVENLEKASQKITKAKQSATAGVN